MSTEFIQPPELFPSERFGFTQVVATNAKRIVYVSGQTALDREFQIVGEDLATQAGEALQNLRHALKAAGAGPADVTSLRIYVVDYDASSAAAISGPLQKFFDGGPPSAQTLIGVQALAMPGLRIEIEATAAVDG